jgi:glycine/D-amino acid oxidase-like deaminating enzyme
MPIASHFDATIVGGGFYGARLALMLRATGRTVLLVERETQLLGRASLHNQARVHNGYHYPRSLLTSLRSRINYARFLEEYADCVDHSFPHYYAVGRGMSKITAAQFVEFCRRIEAPVETARAAVAGMFDTDRIEAVFLVQEGAFDAAKLRARVSRELLAVGVDVRVETEATRLETGPGGVGARLHLHGRDGASAITTELVLNCTYSRLNRLLASSDAPIIPAKHELTEMALVDPPARLEGAAVTVMDGPFFSMMPYPSRGKFTLSHVRYTPHASWHDVPGQPLTDAQPLLANRETRFMHMVRDAARYLPAMRDCRYVDSLWEVKTVLPRSEQDDSRPILLQRNAKLPMCLTVLGAKIDSVYDVEDALTAALSPGLPPRPSRLTPHGSRPAVRA